MLREVAHAEGLDIALQKVHEKFPEIKERLTKTRAYSVISDKRKANRKNKVKVGDIKKIPWVDTPKDQRNIILGKAKTMHEATPSPRWSHISKTLADIYPNVSIPAALNLARSVFITYSTKDLADKKPINVKRAYNRKPTAQSSKQLMLQIINNGSVFQTRITPESLITIKVVQEELS
jgi:hypothetical protein